MDYSFNRFSEHAIRRRGEENCRLFLFGEVVSAKPKQGFEMRVCFFCQKALHVLTVNGETLKARLHRRLLSRQLDAIFVLPKLQPQNRTCKPGAILSAICRRDIAGVSSMFEP